MIQIKKLTTGYSRDKPLLKDFSFDFKDNRIYGIWMWENDIAENYGWLNISVVWRNICRW